MRSGRDMRPTLQSTPSASARARVYETSWPAPMATSTAAALHQRSSRAMYSAERAEDEQLGDAVGGGVEEGAGLGGAGAGARHGAVERVADGGEAEDDRRPDEVAGEDERHGDARAAAGRGW